MEGSGESSPPTLGRAKFEERKAAIEAKRRAEDPTATINPINIENKGFFSRLFKRGKQQTPQMSTPSATSNAEIGTIPGNVTPISTENMQSEIGAKVASQPLPEDPVERHIIEQLQKNNTPFGNGKGVPENISPIRDSTPMNDEIAEANELELMKKEAATAGVEKNTNPTTPIPDSAVADTIDGMLSQPSENVSQMPDSQNTPPDKPAA